MTHSYCAANFIGPATYYPTRDGVAWVVGSYRLTTSFADSVFADGTRNAVIRGVYVGYSAGGTAPIVQIREAGTGTGVAEYLSQRNEQSSWLPGPEGILIPGGFYLTIVTAAASIQIAYDIV